MLNLALRGVDQPLVPLGSSSVNASRHRAFEYPLCVYCLLCPTYELVYLKVILLLHLQNILLE